MTAARLALAALCALLAAGCAATATTAPPLSSPAAITAPATPQPSPTMSGSPAACDASLWAHVYHPDRLKVVEQCKTVTGTVAAVRLEPDGDTHIDLTVADKTLVNAKNDAYQHGDLVLEQICQGHVTQPDAITACQGVPHNQTIPKVGDHVTVTGTYVLDQAHGWMEIHPVTTLTVTGP